MPVAVSPLTKWLVLAVAAVGFLFDTYELLMLPVIGRRPSPSCSACRRTTRSCGKWIGSILWAAALCGGVFGLLGGLLIDRFGRKTVMVGSILLYSLSPVAAAFSTSVETFALFRCTTFIGVCVEFVAAITWLAELFEDKRTKELAIGWTQAFASVGGLVVTAGERPGRAVQPTASRRCRCRSRSTRTPSWRYTLLTGLVPGALILLLHAVRAGVAGCGCERKRAGTLRRPRFGELFAPELRRDDAGERRPCRRAATRRRSARCNSRPPRSCRGCRRWPRAAETAGKPLRDEAAELNQQLNARGRSWRRSSSRCRAWPRW